MWLVNCMWYKSIGACRAVWVPGQDLGMLHLMRNCGKRILSLHCALYVRPRNNRAMPVYARACRRLCANHLYHLQIQLVPPLKPWSATNIATSSHTVCIRKALSSLAVVSWWLQSEDVDSSKESAWLDSDGLEFDWFTWSLLTVTVGTIGSYHLRSASSCSTQQKESSWGAKHLGLILRHSEFEFQLLASIAEQVESSIVAR